MHILITGAAGMVGRKLTERLVKDGALNGRPIAQLTLIDVMPPETPALAGGLDHDDIGSNRSNVMNGIDSNHLERDYREKPVSTFSHPALVSTAACDLSAPGAAALAVVDRPDVIFHLAAIVSGEAEVDLDKGYRINLDGTRALLDAVRAHGEGYCPRLVFTSSVAVFGAPFPASIPDDFHLTPLTSYGAQKAMGELLLADYSRRGILDGVGIRLPTICVRPGKPNRAASGFFSGIIREPLAGQEAFLPVPDTVRHTHASPRAAVGFLLHAAGLPREALGTLINLTMPGVSCTVGEQIASLERIAGKAVAARIRRAPDELVARIVSGWPERFDTKRALALGFRAETSFEEIIRIHIEDELHGAIAA